MLELTDDTIPFLSGATWSTKFACGFAHPIAFLDLCLTKSSATTNCATSKLARVPYIP
jgi:hypothetical protein